MPGKLAKGQQTEEMHRVAADRPAAVKESQADHQAEHRRCRPERRVLEDSSGRTPDAFDILDRRR